MLPKKGSSEVRDSYGTLHILAADERAEFVVRFAQLSKGIRGSLERPGST
jgi:hypothetical protein